MSHHTPGPWLHRGKSDSVHETCDTHPYGQLIFQFHDEFGPNDRDLALILAAPELLSDLHNAAVLLRRYEALHRAKGTGDSTAKAEVNAGWASRFESTVARARGEQ